MLPALALTEIFGILFIATVFRTAFGFGEALIAVPLLALIVPVKTGAPVAVLASILIAGIVVLRDWRHIHFGSVKRLLVSTILGLPFGLLLLKFVPEQLVKGMLGAFLLLFSGYSLFRPHRLSLADDRFAWAFGFVAGISGGSYGMNGPPLAVYGSLRRWNPERFRATMQGYFLPASLLGMVGYGVTGLWTASVTTIFLYSLPAILAGIFVGRWLNRRVSGQGFARSLYLGLILVALVLLSQSFGR